MDIFVTPSFKKTIVEESEMDLLKWKHGERTFHLMNLLPPS